MAPESREKLRWKSVIIFMLHVGYALNISHHQAGETALWTECVSLFLILFYCHTSCIATLAQPYSLLMLNTAFHYSTPSGISPNDMT